MTKYEIKTDRFEHRFGSTQSSIPTVDAETIFRWYQECDCNDPTTEASFDSLEEAKREFEDNYTGYGEIYAEKPSGLWVLRGEVAWLEENEYDEDGEFVQGGDVIKYSAAAYEIERTVAEIVREIGAEGDAWEFIEVEGDDLPNTLDEWIAAIKDARGVFAEDIRRSDLWLNVRGDYEWREFEFEDYDRYICDGCAPEDLRESFPRVFIAIRKQEA